VLFRLYIIAGSWVRGTLDAVGATSPNVKPGRTHEFEANPDFSAGGNPWHLATGGLGSFQT